MTIRCVLEISAELPLLLRGLGDAIARYPTLDDVAKSTQVTDLWASASPESRAALLLRCGHHASTGSGIPSDGSDSARYASELAEAARHVPRDARECCGEAFPAPPLPGPAGALATSLGHDRDDLDTSLRTAVILLGEALAARR